MCSEQTSSKTTKIMATSGSSWGKIILSITLEKEKQKDQHVSIIWQKQQTDGTN